MTDDVERRPERDDWERDVDEARPASPWAWLCYGIGTAADRRNQVLFLVSRTSGSRHNLLAVVDRDRA